MRMNTWLVAAGAVAVLASPVRAQQGAAMPESYREVQLRALALQKTMLLAMVDSMPERLLRDKATAAQRDFAQQIEHATAVMAYIVRTVVGATSTPPAADSAVYLRSRPALHAFVGGWFDWAAGVLRAQSAADRAATVDLFGTRMPRWQVWDEIHQHTIWTAGQVVANFRKNGMAPPGFGFF